MCKQLTIGLLCGVLSVAFTLALHAGECDGRKKDIQACVRDCKVMKDAKIEVTNTDNGVVVKMTATNPEDVKKIQECWANIAACKAARGDGSEKAPAARGEADKSEPDAAKQPKAHSGHDHSGHKH